MPKFCGSCGAQSDDSARICGACGAPLDGNSSDMNIPGINYMDPEKKEQYKKYGILAASGVAALVVIILVVKFILGSVGYKGAIKKFVNAIEDEDAAAIVELIPDCQIGDSDKGDIEDSMEASLKVLIESAEEEYGDDIKLSYKIEEVKKYNDKKLKRFTKDLEERYGEDFDADDITAVVEVELELTIKGDDDKDSDKVDITLIKENGDWKVYDTGIL